MKHTLLTRWGLLLAVAWLAACRSVPEEPTVDGAPADAADPGDVGPPDQSQPDGVPPDTFQPDTFQPDTFQPDTFQPDTFQPDTFQPDVLPADTAPPDAPEPDVGMCKKVGCDCTLDGIQLWGKVKFVTALADFKVKITTTMGFEDLKVEKVDVLPNKCGKWQIITTGIPDFTVEEVAALPDFTIRYVTVFPGLP